jgi:hypothetical protein
VIPPDSTLSTLSTPPPGHVEWLAKQERTRKLRADLKAARDAGKAIRHAQRLEQIRRRDQMTTITAERITTCRYLRRNGELCTAEALDPEGNILICMKHAGRVMEMVRTRRAAR